MKIVVYTVIVGESDNLKPINKDYLSKADFYFFTDKPIAGTDYKTIGIKIETNTPRQQSRLYKMVPNRYFKDYDYHIYLDGSFELMESPDALINKYLKEHDLAVFEHPYRFGLYEEADYCAFFKKELKDKINKQMEFIMSEGYPFGNGLTENGVILRRNNEKVREFNEFWFKHYTEFSTRDQLCFCYCAWKLKMKYKLLDAYSITSTEFKLSPHSI